MQRALDHLASTWTFALVFCALLAVFGLTVHSLMEAVNRVASEEVLDHERKVRDGYAALNDLQRLTNVTLETLAGDTADGAFKSEIAAANDMLYVRATTMHINATQRNGGQAMLDLSVSLGAVVGAVDAHIRADFDDLSAFARDAAASTEVARRRSHQFIDEMRRRHDEILQGQSAFLDRQNRYLFAFSLALTLIGAAALALLRQEVIGRKRRARAEKRAAYLAYFDPLSGLPNRVQFKERATKALTTQTAAAFAIVDLDHFKAINDTYGHRAGDAVITAVASRIQKTAVARNGFAARLSGDEFAVVLPTADPADLEGFAKALVETGQDPILHDGNHIRCEVSIGIATTRDGDKSRVTDYDSMLRRADFALYVSKDAGRDRATLYDAALDAQYTQRRAMTEALCADVQSGKLDFHLQPKVDMATGVVYGFETLARWPWRDGMVGPEVFVPLAEAAGIATEIDLQILRKSAVAVARWNTSHRTGFEVSANMCAHHFSSDALPGKIDAILKATGLPPNRLTLEITESVQIKDWNRAKTLIASLRARGIRIAIDDFGTGYSSLAYLRRMQADEVKIDKALADEIETSSEAHYIMNAIVELAQDHLGFDVVVEGVERASQAQVLRDMGCRKAQGYHFGCPQPAQQALARAMMPLGSAPSPVVAS